MSHICLKYSILSEVCFPLFWPLLNCSLLICIAIQILKLVNLALCESYICCNIGDREMQSYPLQLRQCYDTS